MFLFKIFLYIHVIFSCLSWVHCQEPKCVDQFTITYAEAVGGELTAVSASISSLVVNVTETISVDSILYYITWNISTLPYINNEADPNTALAYVDYTYGDNDMTVYVTNSMKGIVDYNNTDRQEYLTLDFYFDFVDIPDSPCQIDIRHDLLDENTQAPHFELEEYEVDLREDFPILLEIPNLQPAAYDYDANTGNSMFSVETSSGCPLEAMEFSYTCSEGAPVYVSFVLNQPLDYDTMESPYQYICTVTLTDSGTIPLMSNSTIILTVTPFPDENPAFTSDFYNGYLDESLAGSTVVVVPTLSASDLDVPPSIVAYSMTAADTTVGGDEYFSINSSTGSITVTQDIDNDFLAWEIVSFILTACDTYNQCSKSFLSINLPLQSNPGNDSLEFEKVTYTTQILNPTQDEKVLQVHAQSSNDQDDVRYSFVNDGSSGLQYFAIDTIIGEITTTQNYTPPTSYELNVDANDGILTDRTLVNIEVLSTSYTVVVDDSLVFTTIPENVPEVQVYVVTAEGASFFCILDIQPLYFKDFFDIDEENGTIFTVLAFDAEDPTRRRAATIKAGAYTENIECVPSSVSTHVLHNEVVIQVEVTDENDNSPYFVDPSGNRVVEIVYAYPLEVPLQRAIGPVATVLARDDDITQNVFTYEIEAPTDGFEIDYTTGEIYLTEEMHSTSFQVMVSDSKSDTLLSVSIDVLPMNLISTINLNSINESEVENKISEISVQTNTSIYLLYSNLLTTDENKVMVEAQVYSTRSLKLLTPSELSSYLSEAQLNAVPFTDEEYFAEENTYKTWTIVLGCISGVLFLLVVAALSYNIWLRKKYGKQDPKIRTLGQAYANEDFRDENTEPTFASIFGNNPVDGNVQRDSMRRSSTPPAPKRGSAGSQESSSLDPHSSSLYPGTSSTISVQPFTNPVLPEKDVTRAEIHPIDHQPQIYPSLHSIEKHEKETEKSGYPEDKFRSGHGNESYMASAPALESDSEGDSTGSNDKRSNLKVLSEPDEDPTEEEPKSVAFKILVDTKEFEPDSKL